MLTRRGRLALRLVPALIGAGLGVALLLWVSARLWYVEGEGYCIGTIASCFH